MKEIAVAALSALLLTGCVQESLPPITQYTLVSTGISPVSHSPYAHKVLQVAYPQSLSLPMGVRIYYSYGPMERGKYENAYWASAVGQMVQGRLIETLSAAKLFKAVIPYSSSANADMRLESVIYDLSHHIRGDASYAVLSIRFTLIDTQTGEVIKSKRFSYKETTPTVDAKGFVLALNRAMARMERSLISWILSKK